jgi:hypothetical protein
MNQEREIASRIWPHHAEWCTEKDWTILGRAVEDNQPLGSDKLIQPTGQSKDGFLLSLMILYWTMKIVHMAFVLNKELKHLHGSARLDAIAETITKQFDGTTPTVVAEKIREIINSTGITNTTPSE